MKKRKARVKPDPAVATIKMVTMVVLGWAILALLTMAWGSKITSQFKALDLMQMAYCGCGGEEKFRQDQERDRRLRYMDRDNICGLNDIVFRSHYSSAFEPTELEDVPIFKIINYTGNAKQPQVVKDERPTRAYIDLGVLECPLNWYYMSTLEGYLKEKTAEVGGHAILLMATYEVDRTVVHDEMENVAEVVFMSVTAQVIYFAPDRRQWREEWGVP